MKNLLAFLTAGLFTAWSACGADITHFLGTLADSSGQPGGNAEITVYQSQGQSMLARGEMDKALVLTATAAGTFEWTLPRRPTLLVVRKTGLGTTWQHYWSVKREMNERILLQPRKGLAGKVVDAKGVPVPGAEVWVRMAYLEQPQENGYFYSSPLSGRLGRQYFLTRSELDGAFQFPDFPAMAGADLAVRAPGMYYPVPERQMVMPDSMQFQAGQSDLRVQLEPAGTIVGTVRAERTGAGAKGAMVSLVQEPGSRLAGDVAEAESDATGRFRLESIPPGSYRVQVAFGTNSVPQYVAEMVPVSVEAGSVLTNIELRAVAGGFLQLKVADADSGAGVGGASIEARGERLTARTVTDPNGLALVRLPPGEYKLFINATGWKSSTEHKPTVKAGETNVLGVSLAPEPTVTGTIKDTNGVPTADLELQLFPSFSRAGELRTDAQGRFKLSATQRIVRGPFSSGLALLARDPARNLALAEDLDENTRVLDLKLQPGVTVMTQVQDAAGKPLTNATAELVFWNGSSGSHLADPNKADGQGRLEIPGLPPGRRFSLWIGANGYGRVSKNVPQDADTNRVVLEPVVLNVVDRKISGKVLDSESKPAVGVSVNIQGENQPYAFRRTDDKGRFEFDVCEGAIRLNANSSRGGSYASANATVQGGDTEIVLQLAKNSSSVVRRVSAPRSSLQGKSLPDLSGMGFEGPVPTNQPVLLCIFDIGQRPSRRAARVLADKAGSLRSKGVAVYALQAVATPVEALREWRSTNGLPFSVGGVPPGTKATWATQLPSLPWLMLTDARGQVKYDGFPPEDIDAKVDELKK